jgi:glycosyltransferase involved in cell wall biosynthesis
MNIAFIVPRFYPYPGGYEKYVLGLARGLSGAGNKITVLTTTALDLEYFWLEGFRSLPAGRETLDGIEIVRLPICHRRWRRRISRLLGLLPSWELKAQFAAPSFRVMGLRDALMQVSADIIHVGPLPYNRMMYEGVREARRSGIRVVVTPCTHFGEERNDQVSRYYTRKFQMDLLKACDHTFALTRAERQKLVDLGVPAQKVTFTSAGIDFSEVTGGDAEKFCMKYGIKGPIVLHLGMKALEKGSVCVVEAMKCLWRKNIQAWLVLAGPSLRSFDEYLQSQDPQLPRLLNLGLVSEEEKKDALAAATVLVQPSRVESLGFVYLEAWANAKPVIAADMAVTRELIAPRCDGLLVPFGESDTLASAILNILDDPIESKKMGLRGQQKVQNQYTCEAVTDRISPYFEASSKSVKNTRKR